jgi:chromosome segregation ATPase
MQDVGKAKDKASSLSRELEELNQENARVEKQALAVGSKLEENLRTLKHALHQEEQVSISLKDDIWKLNEVLDRSNNEVSSLREELVKYKSYHDELGREAFEIAKNVKALELDIAKQRQVSNTSKEELDLAQNVIIELEKEEKLLEQELDRARLEKDNLINKIFDLHEQLENTHIRVSGVGKQAFTE